MQPEGSLPWLQEPVTHPYSEPVERSPYLQTRSSSRRILILPSIYDEATEVVCLLQVVQSKHIFHFLYFMRATCFAQPCVLS
jgi:hypothetical protein